MNLLAISGSLRAVSSNTTLLRAASLLAPAGVTIELYDGLGTLPHFNPDLDDARDLPAVTAYRAKLAAADAVLISSPEYAHGVSGVLKNALDWVVGSGELVEKPIALLNASGRAAIAHAALAETLRVMNTRFVAEASVTIPLEGRRLSEPDILADPELGPRLRAAIAAVVRAAAAAAAADR